MDNLQHIQFVADGLKVQTMGLLRSGQEELQAEVNSSLLLPECEEFLRYVALYLIDQRTRISSEETLMYGYWITKFQSTRRNYLEAWEYNPTATKYVPGVSLTLTYWRDQHKVCGHHQAEFVPPRPDKLAVISSGVLEGDCVEGVRYPSPEHMSGWWFITDRYDGDIKSLKTEHLYHITAARPDLAKYIALPYGYRFSMQDQTVWYDERVAPPSHE